MLIAGQEWDQSALEPRVQMTERAKTLSFLGRRSFVPRPLSEATEIFDTDTEEDITENGSTPRSMQSVSARALSSMGWIKLTLASAGRG